MTTEQSMQHAEYVERHMQASSRACIDINKTRKQKQLQLHINNQNNIKRWNTQLSVNDKGCIEERIARVGDKEWIVY